MPSCEYQLVIVCRRKSDIFSNQHSFFCLSWLSEKCFYTCTSQVYVCFWSL